MTSHHRAISLVFLSSVLLLAGLALLRSVALPGAAARKTRTQAREQLAASFARLPLRFEANAGQSDHSVKYFARGPGYALFLTSDEAVLSLRRPPNRARKASSRSSTAPARPPAPSKGTVLRLKLVGADAAAVPEGIDPLPGGSNYLTGNDPALWRTNVQAYARVRYRGVYPGTDLVFYGNPRQLEYDFVVAPGGSPRGIELKIGGAEKLYVDGSGELVIAPSAAERGTEPVRMRRPVVYQQRGGRRQEIAGRYVLRGADRVGFEVAAYDASLPLVIDPVLAFSTYLGGSGYDQINAVATDASGNVYVAGYTSSADFPLAAPFRGTPGGGSSDAFVSKISADGSQLLYSTFLGGNDFDSVQDIAADASGVLTAGGYTYSTNFPTANAYQNLNLGGAEGFITRLNAGGSALVYSTYLGGGGDDAVYGLAIDAGGNAYATGPTSSTNFPIKSAFRSTRASASDNFVSKLAPTGGANALIFSSFLGGNSDSEASEGIAVDSSGNVLVTGYTLSTDFPTVNAFQNTRAAGTCVDQGFLVPCYDVFITKVAAAGSSLIYSTYLGGNDDDIGTGIAVDAGGNAYVTGSTASTNFPTVGPFQGAVGGRNDAFLAKLSTAGGLVYSTYLGGSVNDFGDAVAVDDNGDAFVSGITGSNDFPTLNSLQPPDGSDAFVLAMNPAGNGLLYSTFLGGSGIDEGFAIAVDASGKAVVAGGTTSPDFPLQNPFQSSMAQTTCLSGNVQITCPEGFIARIAVQSALFPNGVVNGASFAPNSAIAAGSIASAFGTDLSASLASAASIPLPTTLGNATVRINGILAPLFFVSGGQINLQVPWELAGQSQATVQATAGGVSVPAITLNLANAAPGLFSVNSSGTGQGAIQIANSGGVFAAPAGSIPGVTARPAGRNEFVTIFCTGLGAVTNRPATGDVGSGGSNLANTTVTPVVTIGGIPANVSFAGLAPGFVGLYQVNAQVPANAATGNVAPVVISVNGVASNTVTMAVQ